MPADIQSYFEQSIIALIAERYPEVASKMSILVSGSFGLGLADESSDLDAVTNLEHTLWKAQAGQVQLLLEHSTLSFAKTVGHPEICVHPASWLLDGHHTEFLDSEKTPPWEQMAIENLFELQENLVVHDPPRLLHRLREATAPGRYPDWLWRKQLMTTLRKLRYDDLSDLETTVRRRKTLEAAVILGCVLEDLVRLGFFIHRQYYPWRTHWRWTFEKLPAPATSVPEQIDTMLSSAQWEEKLAAGYHARDLCVDTITGRGLLPPDILEDFGWAIMCKAWSDPNWRDRITRCEQMATEAGYGPHDGWVWSLWGWVDRDRERATEPCAVQTDQTGA